MCLIILGIVKSNKINILKTSNLRYNYNKIFINFISINFTIICCIQNFDYLFSITKNTIIKSLNSPYSFFFELKLMFMQKSTYSKQKSPIGSTLSDFFINLYYFSYYSLICPSPLITYFVVVSSLIPIGPRAWSFCVEIPISPPKPNSPPSENLVEAFK